MMNHLRIIIEKAVVAALTVAALSSCVGPSSPSPTETVTVTVTKQAPDTNGSYETGYTKGYRIGQRYVCNTLYGGQPYSDGWSPDLGSVDGMPLHKATVLIWYADSQNEVPYAITKQMCLANARP